MDENYCKIVVKNNFGIEKVVSLTSSHLSRSVAGLRRKTLIKRLSVLFQTEFGKLETKEVDTT